MNFEIRKNRLVRGGFFMDARLRGVEEKVCYRFVKHTSLY